MILITRDSRNKHGIEVGDVFRVAENDDYVVVNKLFLIERANEFVYSSGHGGIGYQGEIVGRAEAQAMAEKSPVAPAIVKFECTVGRRFMNKQISKGLIVRIAHFLDLSAGRDAIRSWAEEESEVLTVPVPVHK
jgi:hypothetical protein